MNSSLCKLNVQIECSNSWKMILPNILCFNSFMFYICYYVTVKKEKNEMNFKSTIEPSHPIYEITTHAFRLKRLETWLIKDQMLFWSRVWEHNVIHSGCQMVERLQWVRRSWNIPKIGPSYPHFMVYIKYIWKYIFLIDWV